MKSASTRQIVETGVHGRRVARGLQTCECQCEYDASGRAIGAAGHSHPRGTYLPPAAATGQRDASGIGRSDIPFELQIRPLFHIFARTRKIVHIRPHPSFRGRAG
jgi:hypothetical protein